MAVYVASEPSSAETQLAIYNQGMGSVILRTTFSPPSDIHWAIVGCVLADTVVLPDDIGTLVSDITALSEVTSVNGDQLCGQVPGTIETVDHESKLYVLTDYRCQIGTGGDLHSHHSILNEVQPIPDGKKWCVFTLRVPAALNATSIATLESAIQGVTDITLAEHLVHDSTSAEQSGNGTLRVTSHVRIEPI